MSLSLSSIDLSGKDVLSSLSSRFAQGLAALSIQMDTLPSSSFIWKVLQRGNSVESPFSKAHWPENVWEQVHMLSAAAERDLPKSASKMLGAVYTPKHITRRVVTEALELWEEDNPNQGIPILEDPACGAGAFLLSALEIMSGRYHTGIATLIKDHLRGGDIDPKAVEHTRAILEFLLLSEGHKDDAHALAAQCVQEQDFLLDSKPCGTDIYVGNPPYIKIQNIPKPQRIAYEQDYADVIAGSYSTTLLFITQMLKHLPPTGVMGIITQNNLFTSLAAKPLRRKIQKGGHLKRVVDYGHRPVFPGASAYTCLLYLAKSPQSCVDYTYETDVQAITSKRMEPIQASSLRAHKWRLAYPMDLQNLEKIENTGQTLGDVCHIRVGFATLKDRVFLVEECPDQNKMVIGRIEDGQVFQVEKAATVPAIRIADFSAEQQLPENKRRILFPYEKVNGRFQAIEWDMFQAQFPMAAAYLEAYRPLLESRSKGNLPPERWYQWGRVQSMEANGPKLLTKTFNAHPNFMKDPSNSLFCNGYGLFLKEETAQGWTLNALQRVLNSPVMAYYACLTSFSLSGGYPCYQKNFIHSFGLPPIGAHEAGDMEHASNDNILQLYADRLGLCLTTIEATLNRYGGHQAN